MEVFYIKIHLCSSNYKSCPSCSAVYFLKIQSHFQYFLIRLLIGKENAFFFLTFRLWFFKIIDISFW